MILKRIWRKVFKEKKIVVLMYHRIADVEADPWQLAVSPANFEAQLRFLKKRYKVITVEELMQQVTLNKITTNQVCITFDDGYKDNYTAAMPLLKKYKCSAIFFIATHFLEEQQPFWWDELQEIILKSQKLPSPFSIAINDELISIVLDENGQLSKEQQQKQKTWVWSQKPPTQRCNLYFKIWEKMRPLPQYEIDVIMQQIKGMIGVNEVDMRDAMPMSLSDLHNMSGNKNFQIGLHTHTHPALSFHTADIQQLELEENKTILENVCGFPMTTLSYPHGRFNNDTLTIVEKLEITVAFTTTSETVTPHSSLHQLGRYQVLNWNEATFADELNRIFNAKT